jgi:hypothetical protein
VRHAAAGNAGQAGLVGSFGHGCARCCVGARRARWPCLSQRPSRAKGSAPQISDTRPNPFGVFNDLD